MHMPSMTNCWHSVHKGNAEKRMAATRNIYLKEISCNNKLVSGYDRLLSCIYIYIYINRCIRGQPITAIMDNVYFQMSNIFRFACKTSSGTSLKYVKPLMCLAHWVKKHYQIYRVIRNDCPGFNKCHLVLQMQPHVIFFLWGYVKD